MIDLLHLEFRRLFRAKAFYVCLLISLAMILISAATTKVLLSMIKVEEFEEGFGDVMTTALVAPTSFSMLKTMASSSITTILAIFLSLFVTEDYTNDTIKNIYAKGNSRDSIYFSKYISALAAGLIMTVVCGVFSFATGKILFGEIGTMGTNYIPSLFAELLILIAYITIYFAIAISIKKTGASIAISIIGPIVLNLLLSLGNAAIKSEEFNLTEYWLDGRLSILQQTNVTGKEVLIGFIVGALFLLAAGAVGFVVNRSSEQ